MGERKNDERFQADGANEYKVRPARDDDYGGMKSVWFDAFDNQFFGGPEMYDSSFEWAFSKNPDRWAGAEMQWVAETNGDIVAAWATMPVMLKTPEGIKRGHWLHSTAVATRAQRKGLGRRIYRSIISHNDLTFGVGVVNASRALYKVEGVNFVRSDIFGELVMSVPKSCRLCIHLILRAKISEAVELLKSLIRRAAHSDRWNNGNVKIERVDAFTDEITPLLAEIEAEIPIMTQRSKVKLNWFLSNPRLTTEVVVARKSGTISGFAILRSDGMILDLLARKGDIATIRALFSHLATWAHDLGIGRLAGIIPSIPEWEAEYRRAGFRIMSVDFGFFVVPTGNSTMDALLIDPENWYLSMADSDLFTFKLSS